VSARSVAIECFSEGFVRHRPDHSVVAIDVIRATTTAITAVALGRRCYPVASLEAAEELRRRLSDPLLAGELGGNMPFAFDVQNSPAELVSRKDTHRPLVLLSSNGTQLMAHAAAGYRQAFVACLRTVAAQAEALREHRRVLILGAGTRGQFREEDQLCAAWIAERLLASGHAPADARTAALVERWSGSRPDVLRDGRSAAYLTASGQTADLEFVLEHVDDLSCAYRLQRGEVVAAPEAALVSAHA
jgi:2-phosphosulfolactate phosphatase